MKNWKTTVSGIGAALFSLIYLPLRAWRIIQRDGWQPN